jgi:hypothetical protein
MHLYIDIETIPSQAPDAREQIAAEIKPPGNYRKADTIAAWERDDKPALVEDAYLRTSFDGGAGQIVCIGWAIDGGMPTAEVHTSLSQDAERRMLRDFFSGVREELHKHSVAGINLSSGAAPTIVGHNVIGFDIPFVTKRCMILGVKPPIWWPMNPRPYGTSPYDTMLQWAGVGQSISLDKLCRILGVPGKGDGPTGADVWPMVQAEKWHEVASYCMADVERTRAVHRRMTFAGEG